MLPPLVHLVQTTLQHDRVLLTGQIVEQVFPANAERIEYISIVFNLQLNILKQKEKGTRYQIRAAHFSDSYRNSLCRYTFRPARTKSIRPTIGNLCERIERLRPKR